MLLIEAILYHLKLVKESSEDHHLQRGAKLRTLVQGDELFLGRSKNSLQSKVTIDLNGKLQNLLLLVGLSDKYHSVQKY